MKKWIGIAGAFLAGTLAHAQSDPTSGTTFYPSCLAAADIIQGKRPATDSEDAARQLRQASACFGAVTAIMKLAPLLKPEFAMCPPSDVAPDSKDALAKMVLSITAYLKSHPEQRPNNFHQTAVNALVATWPCSK
jgi:Ssp1 endopeptidase immunity protein Rap1a